MATTMRAMVALKPGDYDVMKLQDWPIPSLGPREGLVAGDLPELVGRVLSDVLPRGCV